MLISGIRGFTCRSSSTESNRQTPRQPTTTPGWLSLQALAHQPVHYPQGRRLPEQSQARPASPHRNRSYLACLIGAQPPRLKAPVFPGCQRHANFLRPSSQLTIANSLGFRPGYGRLFHGAKGDLGEGGRELPVCQRRGGHGLIIPVIPGWSDYMIRCLLVSCAPSSDGTAPGVRPRLSYLHVVAWLRCCVAKAQPRCHLMRVPGH